MDMWTTLFAENHNRAYFIPRLVSDAPEHRETSAKLLALTLVILTGTLFIYKGHEIGMTNIPRDCGISEYKDLESEDFYVMIHEESEGNPAKLDVAMDDIVPLAREYTRTPL